MSGPELQHALDLVLQYVATADRKASTVEDAEAMLLRLQQNQIHDLVNFQYYSRELAIALRAATYARQDGLDLDSEYRRKYGCTFGEIVAITMALYGALLTDGQEGFFRDRITNATGDAALPISPSAPAAFESLMSRDSVGLLQQFRSTVTTGYEIYSPSPLTWYPIVRHSDGQLSVPVVTDLLDRPIRLFYDDATTGSDPKAVSVLARAIGRAYAEHVRDSLVEMFGSGNVFDAERVLPTIQGRKVCDFVCVGSSRLLFVEVKTNRLKTETFVTKEARSFAVEAEKRRGLSYAIGQIADSIVTYEAGLTKLPHKRQCLGLLVIAGEIVGLNSPHVRREIDTHLPEATSIPRYEVTDDLGLDALTARGAAGLPIDTALWKKHRDTKHRFDDTHTYFTPDSGLPAHPLSEPPRV